MSRIVVTFEGGRRRRCAAYTPVRRLLPAPAAPSGLPYLGALVNNEVSSLSYPLTADSHLRFLTAEDPLGMLIYRHSISFVLAKAMSELHPDAPFSLQHSFGLGIYGGLESADGLSRPLTRRQVAAIERRMRDIVRRDMPIVRRKLAYAQAVDHFALTRQTDKLNLLKFRNPPRIVIHICGGFSDLAHAPLAASTGAVRVFRVIPYPPGFVLQLPDPERPNRMARFTDQPHLFRIFQEHKEWGRILNVPNVGRLNEIIASGEISEFIKVAEALHEKKIAAIADRIVQKRSRLVLIAGPSSAGKTTFSKRLTVQLRVNGRRPVTLSTDDYFVAEADTPRDADGKPDFEHLEAVDVDLFNRHLVQLLAGGTIEPIVFDFESRARKTRGTSLRLEPDQILIVEGLHGLNPRLTPRVPPDEKFRVYTSALTQLAIDSHNRISTTDNRLMRRLVRDYRFRGHPPLTTLRMWPSVRRGERRWIFPFQGEADAAFNSALDYELAVLKPLVEPLLLQVKPTEPEYAEARRLEAFLSNFLAVPDLEVPKTSILREYIGRSAFRY